MKVEYKGGEINYESYGSGRTIILLHGFLESSSMWNNYSTKLSKTKRVICIDLPGHGKSDNYGYVHSMEFMAECVKSVLDHLNIRKCLIVGHSMGGYVGLAFAELYPDYLKGLCLFFSTSREDSIAKKQSRDTAIKLVKENHKSFIRKAIPLLFRSKNRTLFKDEIKALKQDALQTSQQGVIAALQGMKIRPDRELIIKFCSCRVLFIAGKYDQVISLEAIKEQANASEKAELVIIDDVAHMGHIENKEKCYSKIKSFVNQCFS